MPNLVGIGNSQVPTNAMLGGLAYQDPAHANLTEVEIENIAALKGKITGAFDTVQDVFVYDTRKDSDGGAWRKRCQHTSWYNESPGAYRGHRKDFPAVAILVLEKQQLFIYDGDDPNCSMWMRFHCTTASWSSNATFLSVASGSGHPAKTCTALNGKLVVTGTYGVAIVDFINETQRNQGRPGIDGTHPLIHKYSGNISLRNDTSGQVKAEGLEWFVTVNDICNDASMIVMPNAPIDDTTGLPIPTIAVASGVNNSSVGGVTIIKSDGIATDIQTNGSRGISVQWMGPNRLAFRAALYYGIFNNPLKQVADSYISNLANSIFIHNPTGGYDTWANTPHLPFILSDDSDLLSLDSRTIVSTSANGLNMQQLSENSGVDDNDSMVVGITKDYNTGWMIGNIKAAFLASTDTTDLVGVDLVSNGSFGTDTSGWTTAQSASLSVVSGKLRITNGTSDYGIANTSITTVVGKVYTVTAHFHAGTGSVGVMRVGSSAASGDIANTGNYNVHGNTSKYRSLTFTATGTTTHINLYGTNVNGQYTDWDFVRCRLADPDRSVNSIEDGGLQVYGTINRTAVANGSDLVGYSNFASGNFLEQPIGGGILYGQGSFYFMFWVKLTGAGNGNQTFIDRSSSYGGVSNPRIRIHQMAASGTIRFYTTNGSCTTSSDTVILGRGWTHITCVRRGNKNLELWIDGRLNKKGESVTNFSTSEGCMRVGADSDDSDPLTAGSMSLVRTGASAPTPEQIKKSYNEEKVLFQENAKCTLYGSHTNVANVAYDDATGILHAGTASGRSEFSGLRRINNTTDAITTSISASNGLVVEM